MEQQNFFSQPDLGGVNPVVLNEALREANGKPKYNERMPQVGETVRVLYRMQTLNLAGLLYPLCLCSPG